MTFRVGDDATVIYPITDDASPPGTLNFTPAVRAWQSDDTTVDIANAEWLGEPGAQRDLSVPLAGLPAGLWGLGLTVADGPDLFLGNVYIE